MKRNVVIVPLLAAVAILCATPIARAQPPAPPNPAPAAPIRLLDGFDDPASWQVITADGVTMKISGEPGRTEQCARLNYDFTRGSGYAIIRKRFDLPLPANYVFSYSARGSGPRNTMEFKLVDPTGDNVWWVNRRDFEFPAEWTRLTLPKRKISFAWGPAGPNTPLTTAAFIEIVVTSSSGGKGTVWLDDLVFEELPEVKPYVETPTLTGSLARLGTPSRNEIGADGRVEWTSQTDDETPRVLIDFGQPREIGGMILEWGEDYPTHYHILTSADGMRLDLSANVRGSNGGRDYVQMPDTTARAIEVQVVARHDGKPITLKSVRFMPPEFGDTANALLTRMAEDAPRGWWPRAMRGEATYWTVVGADCDDKEALIGEDGAVEVDKLGFSLEPFVFEGGSLRTWNDGNVRQQLEEGYLPIPNVVRSDRELELEIKAFAAGKKGESNLFVRYVLRNTGDAARRGKLFIALRPLQVNPPYQNLNITGGAAVVHRIRADRGAVMVDDRVVTPLTSFDVFGATPIDGGEVAEHLALGKVPASAEADDPRGLCSGAMEYAFDLAPGEKKVVSVLVPFHASPARTPSVDAELEATRAYWRERLNRVSIRLPRGQERIADSVRANLAYILINRDGPGLQPGSRCYERTWIRDGALTSSAMLALGLNEEVREFLDWFAAFQYDNGKIPCCVDRRGPDPVPEHDSHGQYIAAVRSYFDFSSDTGFLRRHWPHVLKATAYIEFLREQRTTAEFATGPVEKRSLYGLMPESISHEGYSAKPMHSYWDDFWTLKGLHDAAHIAQLVPDAAQATRLNTLASAFARTLNDSIALVTKTKGLDFVPGCAELGDIDATSTTVALFPCAWEPGDLRPLLDRTFEKYWTFFQNRRDGAQSWKDYTPYEHRVVGSMVLLGERARAHEMLDYFFKDQRPGGWRHWSEVVRRDPREPGYIGDMPHTWCGSDYINSVRTMLAYARTTDDALVLGAGLPRSWLDAADGVEVKGLRTEFGPLTFTARGADGAIHIRVQPLERTPPGGIWFWLPEPSVFSTIVMNGAPLTVPADGMLRLGTLPAEVTIQPRARTP